jgi:3-oxoacyl-[acyl-carrier-protein] synthase II
MAPERARHEGREPLATLSGWGVAGDAFHITAPARDGCGLVQAVRGALERADLSPEKVAGINAHGTGTVYNDAMELTAFGSVFGDRNIPLHSIKGAIGHTLGAAGGIETAVALRSLAEGIIPPTVGCSDPEVEGQVGDRPFPLAGDVLLATNSGFGGINAALVLEKGEGRHAR